MEEKRIFATREIVISELAIAEDNFAHIHELSLFEVCPLKFTASLLSVCQLSFVKEPFQH